ncbi:tetratricopeptide repeat protein, partial [Micromonospora sp. PLK6-60]|uniref:tetratricopeptide repeat protein n=1 Tax=Micromonospora sp. PLK6-60 TaxID=2873383 RepID=UPI001CA6BB88
MSHPSPLAAAQHQALALRSGGDLGSARRLLTDAVTAARPSYGEDHRDVLGSTHLLARLHREAGDPAAARRVLEEAYAAAERRWPATDPLMLAISFELASVAEELGNRHEARRNYSRVASAGPAVLGAEHPAVQAAQRYLGGPPAAPQPAAPQPPHTALSGPTVQLANVPGPRPQPGPLPPPPSIPAAPVAAPQQP